VHCLLNVREELWKCLYVQDTCKLCLYVQNTCKLCLYVQNTCKLCPMYRTRANCVSMYGTRANCISMNRTRANCVYVQDTCKLCLCVKNTCKCRFRKTIQTKPNEWNVVIEEARSIGPGAAHYFIHLQKVKDVTICIWMSKPTFEVSAANLHTHMHLYPWVTGVNIQCN